MNQRAQTILKSGSLALVIALALAPGCQQPPDPSKTLKPLGDRYVAVWNTGNVNDLDAIIDPHFVYHSNLLPEVEGIDGLKKIISGFRASYPDLKIVLESELYSGNRSAVRWTLTGTNTGPGEMPPTGKPVKLWGISLLEYADGKITAEWLAFDNQSYLEQLGFSMMPPSQPKAKSK